MLGAGTAGVRAGDGGPPCGATHRVTHPYPTDGRTSPPRRSSIRRRRPVQPRATERRLGRVAGVNRSPRPQL
ncbi:hypothetical protein ADK74_22075 [Streptomyces decoyicus]|nr:hypothetical protein ADK74_22075 [Streptomyces decoyicus]